MYQWHGIDMIAYTNKNVALLSNELNNIDNTKIPD